MNGHIGLVFLLKSRNFLRVITTEKSAKEIVDNWCGGFYKARNISIIGDTISNNLGFGCWAVLVEDISAIHTQPLEQPPNSIGSIPPKTVQNWNRSGI